MMDLLRDHIKFPSKDIPSHEYFFREPEWNEPEALKKPFKKNTSIANGGEVKVYKRIEETLKKIDEEKFNSEKINRALSEMLYKMDQ